MSDLALGVNYWPASSAMRMWQRFDATEIERDFARAAAAGCNTVRIFLLWEDFQPDPRSVDDRALERLRAVADIAARTAVKLIPTLFTGHMSGVNWIPGWALGEQTPGRFRTVTGGAVARRPSRDWAQDAEIRTAQALLAREAAGALAGHRALGMWDLGNENSNSWVPQSREDGRRWLHAMAGAIRDADTTTPITLGLHAEDLEEDRRIGPAEAAEVSDVLSMHGYPMYLRWARGKDDARVLPFLAAITRWLGQKDVLFEEFGAPTLGPGDPPSAGSGILLGEAAAASYTRAALTGIHEAGCTGALLWCYADYDRAIWTEAPLDEAKHERHFGLWHADGTPKPVVAELGAWRDAPRAPVPDAPWIRLRREEFYLRPLSNLTTLYDAYRSRP